MARMNIYFFHLMLSLLLLKSDGAKILGVFPMPSISHQVVFRPLTQELARRGHEVTVITTDPAFSKGETPENLTEIDIHDISYTAWRNSVIKAFHDAQGDTVKLFRVLGEIWNDIFEKQMTSHGVQKMLNETKEFDLIIAEACVEGTLTFSHIYKAPVIQISSLGAFYAANVAMGIPTHPLLYKPFSSKKIYNLTMWEKVAEVYEFFRLKNLYEETYFVNAKLKKIFGPEVPRVEELMGNVDMLFLNIHPMWEENVPVPPNVIHIWGIHKRVEKELPEDLKSYLDASKHGVIYMSFGTNAVPSLLPPEQIQAFVKVFSELPYDILWKYDKDELPGRSENVRLGQWFPQSDLLKHPKIKLFITQGGLQSTEEAIDAGVPLIGVPILGDQWFNVQKYSHFKIGEELDINTLTDKDVRRAINTVLGDDSYRQNMIKLRTLMRDEPEPALERAVWWTEYVLRHKGAKHLRAAAANLSWAEYYELKLVSLVLISLSILSFVVLLVVRFLFKSYVTKYFVTSKYKKN